MPCYKITHYPGVLNHIRTTTVSVGASWGALLMQWQDEVVAVELNSLHLPTMYPLFHATFTKCGKSYTIPYIFFSKGRLKIYEYPGSVFPEGGEDFFREKSHKNRVEVGFVTVILNMGKSRQRLFRKLFRLSSKKFQTILSQPSLYFTRP